MLFEIGYFKIADKYNIIDRPNHRSSHTEVTIRGGGIIFPIAMIACAIYLKYEYIYFIIGLLLISIISFIDDVKAVSNRIRICFHLISVSFLFYQLNIFILPVYLILIGFILIIGTINAINFMDGINGITGGFGLITLCTFYYINKFIILFTDSNYLIGAIISLIIFVFFNFRTKAKCFAGDVGSVSLAFIIIFFILQLIIKTSNLNYLFMLLVYGLDTVTTIIFRAIRKENVFKAHRSHFYQYWANEKQTSHLLVAISYIIIQTIINFCLLKSNPKSIFSLAIYTLIAVIVFILIRLYFEGYKKLINKKAKNSASMN